MLGSTGLYLLTKAIVTTVGSKKDTGTRYNRQFKIP